MTKASGAAVHTEARITQVSTIITGKSRQRVNEELHAACRWSSSALAAEIERRKPRSFEKLITVPTQKQYKKAEQECDRYEEQRKRILGE